MPEYELKVSCVPDDPNHQSMGWHTNIDVPITADEAARLLAAEHENQPLDLPSSLPAADKIMQISLYEAQGKEPLKSFFVSGAKNEGYFVKLEDVAPDFLEFATTRPPLDLKDLKSRRKISGCWGLFCTYENPGPGRFTTEATHHWGALHPQDRVVRIMPSGALAIIDPLKNYVSRKPFPAAAPA